MKAWAFLPFGLAALAVVAPSLFAHGYPAVGASLQRGFALVCHQQPARSFWLFGGSVAVCARCLGIYLGAAIGLLLENPRRFALRLLVVAAILNMIDVLTELAGLHGNWLGVRFALGFFLGTAAVLLVPSPLNNRTGNLSLSLHTPPSRPRSSPSPVP